MKVLLAVAGSVLSGGGFLVFMLSWIDGLRAGNENSMLVGPSSTLVVAGAVFVLASVLVGGANRAAAHPQRFAPPMPGQPTYHQPPGQQH